MHGGRDTGLSSEARLSASHVGMQVQLLGTLDTIDVKYDWRIRGLIGFCQLSNVNLVRFLPACSARCRTSTACF